MVKSACHNGGGCIPIVIEFMMPSTIKPLSSKDVVLAGLRVKVEIMAKDLEVLRLLILGVEKHAEDTFELHSVPRVEGGVPAIKENPRKVPESLNGDAVDMPGNKYATTRNGARCAVRAAIIAQTTHWKAIDIRAYLDTHFPALSVKISGARLSQEIYSARLAGLAKHSNKGPAGSSHEYMTISTPV